MGVFFTAQVRRFSPGHDLCSPKWGRRRANGWGAAGSVSGPAEVFFGRKTGTVACKLLRQ